MIQQKLEAYRRKKQKEKMIESMKSSIKGVLLWRSSTTHETLSDVSSDDKKEELEEVPYKKSKESTAETKRILQDCEDTESYCSDESTEEVQATSFTKVLYLLYFVLWATLYIIALEVEFGAVYFIISTLIIIWLNTRSRPRKKGEPSAYSVFNPNCEAIDGTLDASQFEREIRYGVSSIH